jgi:glycosyltransferase involved in cell wall biosynthesis
MKIGIDARFLTHPQAGGFKTYTQNLIAALAREDRGNDYVLYVDRQPNGEAPAIPWAPNIVLRIVRGEWPMLGMLLREQIGLAWAARRDQIDVLHSPALTAPLFLSCPLVITLHDTIWYTRPASSLHTSFRRRLMTSYYRHIPRWAARKAAVIITVSKTAKADIVSRLGISPDQVVVTYEAAAPDFQPVPDPARLNAVRAKYALPLGFIMAIGSADPRKNISFLLDAYARLPDKMRGQHHLVIVWTHQYLAKEIARQVESLGLTQYCHFVHSVNNQDLVCLYNSAALFVFPSRNEGFGLPPLEAMTCGTAVIAANNSSIPEIVGDGAMLFEPEYVEKLVQAMVLLLTNDRERFELVRRGYRRAASFSWTGCAQQTLAAYRKCGTVTGSANSKN